MHNLVVTRNFRKKVRSDTAIFAALNDPAFVDKCANVSFIGLFIFYRVIKHCSGRSNSICYWFQDLAGNEAFGCSWKNGAHFVSERAVGLRSCIS